MAITTGQVTIGLTATLIIDGSASTQQRTIYLHDPPAGSAVYIGPDNGVLTTTGYELDGGDTVRMLLNAGESLWGIVASGSQVVSYLVND